jgi:hypothetical protein
MIAVLVSEDDRSQRLGLYTHRPQPTLQLTAGEARVQQNPIAARLEDQTVPGAARA